MFSKSIDLNLRQIICKLMTLIWTRTKLYGKSDTLLTVLNYQLPREVTWVLYGYHLLWCIFLGLFLQVGKKLERKETWLLRACALCAELEKCLCKSFITVQRCFMMPPTVLLWLYPVKRGEKGPALLLFQQPHKWTRCFEYDLTQLEVKRSARRLYSHKKSVPCVKR